ncbi:MAG: ABC transporter ATP-binding protein [Candidatus Rokubacteria bacterium]|nr:ABC transporter ATP-binding protein [Candidatus Rokubacteria bacterium]
MQALPVTDFALRLDGVNKAFGGLRAVEDVALAVRPGERRALIGPNGAGKTTLFNMIAGALPVTSGTITLFGRDVTRVAAQRRAWLGLGRTFQISNLFPTLTVAENCLLAVQALTSTRLMMHRPLSGYHDLHARAQATLEAVGLAERAHATVRNLSHGEQRQLEIGLALAGAPRLLLLDEPTAGLSPAESQAMAQLITRLDPAITVLIIEHDMDIVLELARHVTVLHQGRVIADGTRDDVRADPLVREIYLGA